MGAFLLPIIGGESGITRMALRVFQTAWYRNLQLFNGVHYGST